jgi:surface carbohydrate biosynthesis protein
MDSLKEPAIHPGPTTGRPLRIGLVMDHPQRDLTGVVLLALELAEAGAKAVILPQYMSWISAYLSKVDAVVYNYARRDNIGLFQWLARQGKDIFVLDTEGYLSSDRHKMLLDAIHSLDLGNWLEGYFVWGPASGQAIAKADPRLAAKVVVTGCPRFDLLSPRWRGMLSYEHKDYILINTNFNSVNPLRRDLERERKSMLLGGWEPAYLDQFLTDMRRAFEGFLELCATLPKRLPHRQFIVRPHPFEWPEPYLQATAGLPNVHVNTTGEVPAVLRNASRIVHLNCNTSVETRMLGAVPIQAGFLNTDFLRTHLPLYTGVSVIAESLDELCRMLDDEAHLAAKDNQSGIAERWIHPSFHLCDGFAARRAAQEILRRCREPDMAKAVAPAPRRSPRQELIRNLRVALCGVLGTAAVEDVRAMKEPRRRAKQFSAEQLRALVGQLSAHASRPAPPVRRLRSPWTWAPMTAVQIG